MRQAPVLKSNYWTEGVFHHFGWAEGPLVTLLKTFPREFVNTEISPLRFASVEMTKGRVAASKEGGCWRVAHSSPILA
jgi:hypothetical protein